MAKALTAKAVENAHPEAARREIPDGLLAGLYLVVQPSGAKSWAIRYRFGGTPKKYTIGRWPGIDLAAARELGRKALFAVAEGRDPGAERKEIRRAVALNQGKAERDSIVNLVQTFIDRYAMANTRETTWKETERLLKKDVVPAWRGRRIQEITRADVIDLLDRIVDRGSPIAANRTLAAVRRMLAWCAERGMIASSPCHGVKPPSGEHSRDRVLSDDEVCVIWNAAEMMGYPYGPLTQLLMLTGQRRDEVAEMRWSEIDLTARTWTLPKERVKNAIAHQVPLSTMATAVLERLPRIQSHATYVFTAHGEKPTTSFSRPKQRLDRLVASSAASMAAGPVGHWTFHDLRRTAATGMARLGVNLPVIEKVLNHTSGSFGGIVAVYQRHSYAEEKRAALELWGEHIGVLVRQLPDH